VTLEIPADKVSEALTACGVPLASIFLADEFYAVPTPGDVTDKIARQFSSILGQMGYSYKAERRDCDDFARWASGWASFFHSEQPKPLECGLAFGEVWCERLKHAFNFAIHRSDAEILYAAFYEPQISNGFSFNPITLTQLDAASVYLCKA